MRIPRSDPRCEANPDAGARKHCTGCARTLNDCCTPLHSKHAIALGHRVRKLQRILGNYQDSVMTRAYLEKVVPDPDLPPETGQASERIISVERRIAEAAERQYLQVRRNFPDL